MSECLPLSCDGVAPAHTSFLAKLGGMCFSPSDPGLNKSVEEMDGCEDVFGGVMPSSKWFSNAYKKKWWTSMSQLIVSERLHSSASLHKQPHFSLPIILFDIKVSFAHILLAGETSYCKPVLLKMSVLSVG